MERVEKAAGRLNVWSSLGERIFKIAEWVGLSIAPRDVIVTAGLAGTYVWSLVREGLPWYLVVPLGVLAIGAGLHLFAGIRRAISVRGLKSLDIQALGRDCQQLRSDLFDFLVSRQEAAPNRNAGIHAPREQCDRLMEAAWEAGVNHSRQTEARMIQRFGHRMVALSHQLKQAGIAPPDLWGFSHNAPNIAAHIGAVGELLERGLLKEARDLTFDKRNSFHGFY